MVRNRRVEALLLALLLLLSACGPVAVPDETVPTTIPPTTVTTEPPTTAPPTTAATEPPVTEPVVLARFETWLERNEDFVGWITVPGTIIDYPVVYCEDNAYYLKHDIDRQDHADGTIFLAREAGLLESNRSWALFGHHRKNGSMFSDLHKYKQLDFLRQSPVFTFDTLYREAQYVVFSVFYMAGNDTRKDAYFYYYLQGDFETDDAFMDHAAQLQARSIYDIPVEVEADDQLVILTCCTYETADLRIAVAARRLREDERPEDFDTAAWQKAEAPFYPEIWYQKFGGKPSAEALALMEKLSSNND